MKIVIAPDSFKESMTALEAAQSIEKGFKDFLGEKITTELIPMADGGEGTTRSMADALNGTIHTKTVTGPNGNKVQADYAILEENNTAVMEMAEASGIGLTAKEKRNPLKATTYGTGELIKAALDHGVDKIILGIGGSATNDGGAGMVQALGGKLLDADNNELEAGGGALSQLRKIDVSGIDRRLAKTSIVTACDVNNPLTGPNGASAVYGPQKGADEKIVALLDDALSHFAEIIRSDIGRDVENLPGAGAAGGLGAGLTAFLNASLEPGIEIVLKETNFYEKVKGAELIITGEGKIDHQTVYGKTPIGVAKASAKSTNAPVIALCGQLGQGYEAVFAHGITAAFSIMPGPESAATAMANGKEYISKLARNIAAVKFSER
ncbi:glycerate kinase [Alteribacillus sp. YIM 98480]|uniref:glycerate kinase family protein n=1 Tax=Alteribacillus sp. YIM 98480 TaxID=2606599 RepID=UPI00131B8880|nr:glycerate kinase [Alteribacillus sp. YIM 98480]